MAKVIERIGDKKKELKVNVDNKYLAKVQNDLIEEWRENLIDLTLAIQRGDVTALTKSGEILKRIHMASLIAGKNGDLNRIKERDYNSLQTILRNQLFDGKGDNGKPYGLKHLFEEVRQGTVSDAQLRNRLNLYSKSGKATKSLSEINLKQDTGYKSKRRILGNCVHCDDCVRYAGVGWVGIDSDEIPPIAVACKCKNNCRCTFVFSKQIKF